MAVFQIALLVAGFVIYKVLSSFIARRRFQSFAENNGCSAPFDVTPPFPWGFRRLWQILNLKKSGEDVLDDLIMSDFDQASDWTIAFRTFSSEKMIMTADPINLQAMLATQFKDFETGVRRYKLFKPLLGRSIFSSDGPFWEHSRALFRPQFARENINDLEMTDKASTAFINALGSSGSTGWTTGGAVMPLLQNFTLDTATHFLFGESVESQEFMLAGGKNSDAYADSESKAHSEEAHAFTEALSVVQDVLVTRVRVQGLHFLSDSFKFRRALSTIRQFVAPISQRAIDNASSSMKRDDRKQSLMTNLATQTQDRTELRNQTLAILLAGRDTTSAMLGWALCRLALHPEICSKLRSIVLREFPSGETITFAKLKGCRYLQHFLNEVLRLHPTVPVNERSAVKDTTLPTGGGPDHKSPIAIRKGSNVLFSVYIMHRRKDLWGPDALEFKPERWSDQRFPAWQYLPFLGGPRICIGQQFALTEASYLIVRLLQHFDAIEPIDRAEMQKLKKGLGVTMWTADGTQVRFRKASNA